MYSSFTRPETGSADKQSDCEQLLATASMYAYAKLSIVQSTVQSTVQSSVQNPRFTEIQNKYYLNFLHENIVLVPADKAANNVIVVCKKYYLDMVIKELSSISTYIQGRAW